MRFIARLPAVLLILVSAGTTCADPLWSTPLTQEVKWSRLTPAGTLIIGGKDTLSHVNTTTGEVLWHKEGMFNLAPFNLRFAGAAPVVVVSQLVSKIPQKNNLRVLDLTTGRTVWETGVRMGASLGGYTYPARNLVLFVREVVGEKGVKNGTYISAHELSSGQLLWLTRIGANGSLPLHPIEQNGFVSGSDLSGHPDPIVTDDAIYLTAGDIRAFSMRDGTLKWHYKLKASNPGLKRTYAPPVLADGVLYAAGSNRVVAVNAADGSEIWQAKISKGAIPQLEVVGDRIVGRLGGTFSNGKKLLAAKPFGAFVVDRNSGALIWQWKKAKDSITNLAVFPELDQIVLADRQSLHVLALSADKPTVVRTQKLEFKRSMGTSEAVAKGIGAIGGFMGGGLSGAAKGMGGGDRSDPPLDITRVGSAVVVRGQYHVLAHDLKQGENTWSIEFAPPGVSPFSLIAMGAVTAGVAYGNSRQGWGNTSASTLQSTNNISNAYQNEASKRFAVSKRSEELAFFLTRQEKQRQLIGISLATGSQVGAVLMAEKEPQFMVDSLGRRVYHFGDNGVLQAFEF